MQAHACSQSMLNRIAASMIFFCTLQKALRVPQIGARLRENGGRQYAVDSMSASALLFHIGIPDKQFQVAGAESAAHVCRLQGCRGCSGSCKLETG